MRNVYIILASLMLAGFSAHTAFACGSDPTPAIAATYGLTCETFIDNMNNPATFDIANSLAPGYHWYGNNNMPDAAQTICPTEKAAPYCWPPQTPQTEDYTINSSGLTMNSTTSGDNYPFWMWQTCYWDGNNVRGTVFTPPFYVDVTYSFSGTPISPLTYSGWSVVWMQPIQWMSGGQLAGGVHTIELDLFESPYGSSIHDYYTNNTTPYLNEESYNNPSAGASPIGMLVVIPQLNSGVGLTEWASNDIAYDTLQWSPTMVPIGRSGSTGLPSGTFSALMQQNYCLMTTNGTGQTTNISRVAVWQMPPGNGGDLGVP